MAMSDMVDRPARSTARHLILVGTHGSGLLHALEFDEEASELQEVNQVRVCERPGWLTVHPSIDDIVYCTSHSDGRVLCLRVKADGSATVIDECPSLGRNPVHLAAVQDGSGLFVANYGHGSTGSVTYLPLDGHGRFRARTPAGGLCSYVPDVQSQPRLQHPRHDAPHPHQILLNGNEILVPDLGSNVIRKLALSHGTLSEVDRIVEGFEDGDGPRNVVFHPNGHVLYCINEIRSVLSVHRTRDGGPPEMIARLNFRPTEARHEDYMIGCQLQLLRPIAADAPYVLLCSNRNSKHRHLDAITVFTIDQKDDDGIPRPAEDPYFFGGFGHIRALQADRSGRYIFTGGRDKGGISILERQGRIGDRLVKVASLDIPYAIAALWMS